MGVHQDACESGRVVKGKGTESEWSLEKKTQGGVEKKRNLAGTCVAQLGGEARSKEKKTGGEKGWNETGGMTVEISIMLLLGIGRNRKDKGTEVRCVEEGIRGGNGKGNTNSICGEKKTKKGS